VRKDALTADGSLANVASVLSSATLRSLSSLQPMDALTRLARTLPVATAAGARTIGDMFDAAYDTLQRDYRNEYVFKNAVVSKIVFGRHRPTTASALLELSLGDSYADVAIMNGTSTVYEIKTDLDSFARLPSQLANYQTRVEHVHVVVSDRRAAAAERHVPDGVGLIALLRGGSLRTIRDSASNLHQIRADHLFGSLRQAEATRILEANEIHLSGATAVDRWEELRRRFAALDGPTVHRGAVAAFRARGMQAMPLAVHPALPRSARALAYAAPMSKVAANRLLSRLGEPIPRVWGS
jgi:hypothetical protein